MNREDERGTEVSQEPVSSGELDDMLQALAAEQRRMILLYLDEHGSATVEELVDVVVGWSSSRRERSASSDHWEQTRTELHHNHLPMLTDAALVDYDTETESVSLEALPPSTRQLLSVIQELDDGEAGT